jgi:uncharacterized phage protein gp47/JayE
MSGSAPVCTIDATGIHQPAFSTVLAWFTAGYQGIYGSDVDLSPDTQDGQWITIQAMALSQANDMCVATYNSYSPAGAQGTGLSNAVRINGLTRLTPSSSTVDVVITGTVGVTISGGIIQDANDNLWNLPATVVIPPAGYLTVTATAQQLGAIQAPAQTFDIFTPVRNWQSAISSAAATPGLPVEDDASLRGRQAISTDLPAQSVIDACTAALLLIPDVTAVTVDNNTGTSPDGNGVPGHTVAYVVEGGDATAIAQTILNKKGPGCGTYGTTSVVVDDAYGIPHTISFYRPAQQRIQGTITVTPGTNYTTAIGNEIIAAVVAYINGLGSGVPVQVVRLSVPAQLAGPYAAPASPADALTYELVSVQVAINPASPGSSDIPIAFNQIATAQASDFTVVT